MTLPGRRPAITPAALYPLDLVDDVPLPGDRVLRVRPLWACEVLLRAAQARGFHRFVALVLWDNRPIRSFLRRVGDIVATSARHGVTEVSFVARSTPRS